MHLTLLTTLARTVPPRKEVVQEGPGRVYMSRAIAGALLPALSFEEEGKERTVEQIAQAATNIDELIIIATEDDPKKIVPTATDFSRHAQAVGSMGRWTFLDSEITPES